MTAKALQLLLVEDNPAHAELIRRAFLAADRPVALTVARTLHEARATLALAAPDLAIIDLLLPDGRGLELLPGPAQDVAYPAVLMTSYGNEQAAVEAIKTGAVDYVVKSDATLADMPHIAERALRAWGHISERKRLEAQLRQAQKMEAIGTLAGGIAHDFNNILTAILGYTELALDDLAPEHAAWRYLGEVRKAGVRAKTLVQQILTFSRRTEQPRRPVALALLIEEALALLRASLPSTIAIEAELAVAVGPVLAEPTQLHQVLLNLCANAAHAMRATGGCLGVRLAAVEVGAGPGAAPPELAPGAYACITVSDTGQGMAPEVLERIFEPFFTTKGPGEGTGMGLALVHGIVTNHGGAVQVASGVGQGTTFRVYLPQSAGEVAAGAAGGEAARGVAAGHPAARVLLVDDEEALVQLGEAILRRLGYEVVVCTSSAEALAVFEAAPQYFDVVITDQTMPHLTGEGLAQAVRQLRPEMPIILCTGFSHVMHAERARDLGIDAFVLKPLAMQELAQTIEQVLAARRQSPA
jgi:signal transduction histidine kinase